MNIKKINSRGGQPYEAPLVKSLDIQSEGLLCGSGDLTIKDWERDDEALDFNN